MEGDMDAFDFVLAEALGKSLGEVWAMPNDEIVRWQAFYTWRKAMKEIA